MYVEGEEKKNYVWELVPYNYVKVPKLTAWRKIKNTFCQECFPLVLNILKSPKFFVSQKMNLFFSNIFNLLIFMIVYNFNLSQSVKWDISSKKKKRHFEFCIWLEAKQAFFWIFEVFLLLTIMNKLLFLHNADD